MLYDYELALVISATSSDDKQKKIIEDLKTNLTTANGKMKESKILGKKKFAYPIKKESEGFYHILTFSLMGEETVKLLAKLKLNNDVLRFLLIRK